MFETEKQKLQTDAKNGAFHLKAKNINITHHWASCDQKS